jgi:AcrR family transcriptional regulator
MTPTGEKPRANPRVERTKAHVLAVARELLLEAGPLDLTYTAISNRSGVTRQTLYRHWPTREALLAQLVLTSPNVAYPQANVDPQRVITEFLVSLRGGMSDPPTAAALMTLAAQADRDPASSQALSDIATDRRLALNTLLSKTGIEVDAADFAVLCGPIIYRLLVARTPVTDEFIRWVVTGWTTRLDRRQRDGDS